MRKAGRPILVSDAPPVECTSLQAWQAAFQNPGALAHPTFGSSFARVVLSREPNDALLQSTLPVNLSPLVEREGHREITLATDLREERIEVGVGWQGVPDDRPVAVPTIALVGVGVKGEGS